MMRWLVSLSISMMAAAALAADSSAPLADPVLERPTLHSLGLYWIIRGDDNHNATVALDYRRPTESTWRPCLPLFRVEKGAHITEKYGTTLDVPGDATLLAGSALLLDPATTYQLRVRLTDPDGGSVEKILTQSTRIEPQLPANAPFKHVVPGQGGGTGTAADPFKGLSAAQASAKPGDHFLLAPGRYAGVFEIKRSGTPDSPIVWRGSSDGEVIIDAQGSATEPPSQGIAASKAHDVWFENLSVINAKWAIVAHDASRLVIRRCHLYKTDYGITATRDTKGAMEDFFICDNLIEGPCTWPRTKGIEDPRGIQITGSGHDVCYNRIHGFADAIDTMPSKRCCAIDFHHNDCSECTDDGMEMDYSQRNTRAFYNRFTNVFQGISVQPVYGGPTYIFRNAIYNIGMEPFKMHNSPSGALIFHNTCVKAGPPLLIYTREKVRNCVYRNNLFLGSSGNYAYEADSPMVNCDFDYDGFGGGPFPMFLKWNNKRYRTFEEMKAKAPIERHAMLVDPATAFASGARVPAEVKTQYPPQDLRPSPQSKAIDAGVVLPGLNNDFRGKAPDLGAYEDGQSVPHYGPRPR